MIHQIPPKPDYLRVKVRRRLQRLGAVALKNTVYVLPERPSAIEDFQWLRREILAEGGDATVCTARLLEGWSDREVRELFQTDRNAEYLDLLGTIREVRKDPGSAELERLRRQLAAIEERDYFGASRGEEARTAMKQLEQTPTGPDPSGEIAPDAAPRGATWVTRQGVFVDRIGSAWLIRRFIDPEARLKFVSPAGYRAEPGELRFDMFEGEFTHVGDACTFETLLARFKLEDAALRAVGEIVHDIDCKDEKFGRPEARWLNELLRGVTVAHGADQERVDAGLALFDALYASLRPVPA